MKKVTLKVVSLFMAAILLFCMAGCKSTGTTQASNSGDSVSTGKNIRVWIPPFGTKDTVDKAFWQGIFKPFEQKTGSKIDFQIISWDSYADKYLSGINAGIGPDLGYMYADIFPDFIKMGALDSLETYLTAAQRSNYIYLDDGNIMGKQYGLPYIVGNPRIMFYNKKLLKEANIPFPTADNPLSWDDFITACQKLTKDTNGDKKIDQWGIAQGWGSKTYGEIQSVFTPYLLQAGSQMYSDDGKTATFGGEAGIKAAQFLHDLVYKYKVLSPNCTGMTDEDIIAQFVAGKVGFFCEATSVSTQFKNVDWGYFPALKGQRTMTMEVVDQLVLMKAARNKSLTYQLMLTMTSGSTMTAFHKTLRYFPPIAKDEEYNDDPNFKDLYTNHNDMLSAEKPVASAYQIDDYLYKNLQLMMMNQMTPEEALKAAQDQGNQTLAKAYSSFK